MYYIIFETLDQYVDCNHAISLALGYERDGTTRYAPEQPELFNSENRPVMPITSQVFMQCLGLLQQYHLVDTYEPNNRNETINEQNIP